MRLFILGNAIMKLVLEHMRFCSFLLQTDNTFEARLDCFGSISFPPDAASNTFLDGFLMY